MPTTPSTSTMETDQQATQKRPITIDPDDMSILTSAKKARIAPDPQKKIRCLKFLLLTWEKINCLLLKTTTPNVQNISFGNQVMNIVFTTFSINRQIANSTKGNAEAKAKEKAMFTTTSVGITHTISYDAAMKACIDSATEVGLVFKKFANDDPENWYGTAAPYADFFVGNRLRLQELRLGHDNMPIGKVEGVTKQFPISKYGFNGSHHILMEGSTFPPESRGSMAQSLGPGTTLICHMRSPEQYRGKWTAAAKRAISHIPVADEILEAIRNKKAAEVRGLISVLADILLITTSRQAQRMFFPISILYGVWKQKTDPNSMILNTDGTVSTYIGGDKILEYFNVSGTGGFYLYKLACMFEWSYEGNMNDIHAKQILFHSIFGSYKEDLTVLEQITDLANWNTREEMGNIFQKMTTSGRLVKFKPVNLKIYSKLSSANLTGLLAASYNQVSSLPVFSGRRRQNFSDDFFEQIGNRVGTTMAAKTIPQLTNILIEILSELREMLVKGGKTLDLGTVKWASMSDIHPKNGGTPIDEIVEGRMKFFLGKNSY